LNSAYQVHCSSAGKATVSGVNDFELKCDVAPVGDHWRAIHESLQTDILAVGAAVWLADRTCPRRIAGNRAESSFAWQRDIDLHIEVREPDAWTCVAADIGALLRFLTDDRWSLHFEPVATTAKGATPPLFEPGEVSAVCLFSGGLDSTLGFHLHSSIAEAPLVPVPIIRNGVELGHLRDGPMAALRAEGHAPIDVRLRLQAERPQHARSETNVERTQRSRGFVFLMNVAAVALAARKTTVYVYEPGAGAFNPPMSDAQLGAFNTRAMHPGTFYRFEQIMGRLTGSQFRVEGPHLLQTKGELCVAAGPALLRLAPVAVSCDRGVGHRADWKQHCGKCTSCLLRRTALFHALGAADPTRYLTDGDALRREPTMRAYEQLAYRLGKCCSFYDLLHVDATFDEAWPYFDSRGINRSSFEAGVLRMMQAYGSEIVAWIEGVLDGNVNPEVEATR
jgi:hypothetical protein